MNGRRMGVPATHCSETSAPPSVTCHKDLASAHVTFAVFRRRGALYVLGPQILLRITSDSRELPTELPFSGGWRVGCELTLWFTYFEFTDIASLYVNSH
jgi:hypothetical protein